MPKPATGSVIERVGKPWRGLRAPFPCRRQAAISKRWTTLRIYAHVLRRSSDFGLRVDALIDWAQTGTNHENGAGVPDRVAPGGEVGSA
jgi:hypothetical protein